MTRLELSPRKASSKWFWILLTAALVVVHAIGLKDAEAAGLLIADGGLGGVLEINTHDVKVTINNGIAVTRVTQVFHNTENRQVEALYTFPVPKGASVANFSMWINGKEMVGEVLEKQRAREIYNSYKRQRRDPGLLEQVNYKTFEMRIFPIAAGADQKVQITYYQALDVDHDRALYVYPLATATRRELNARTTGRFAMDVDLKSSIPVTLVESPSHGSAFVVADHSDTVKHLSLETAGASLNQDVVVSYDLARPKTGLDLITSRLAGEDGYFLLTLTAGKELALQDQGMDYLFLLDISGSMANDRKLTISRQSLQAFIAELSEDDRFELMTFNVNPQVVFGQLQPARPESKTQAQEFMGSQQARGGTILAPAMTAAYRYGDPDRTLNVVILSDGMTEQKERQTLMQLIGSRPANTRVFCIGIGNEVNRPLLEQMAEDSGGLAAFVSHGDDFQRQAKAFRRKLMHPAATNLELEINGVQVFELEPRTLPNLYHGSPVRLYGRYRGSGEAEVILKAEIQGQSIRQTSRLLFPSQDTANPEIERMWAWARVDRLLKQADRSGQRGQVLDEIIRLGETYSIVTEYTSFLVLENDAEYQRWKIERRNRQRMAQDRKAQAQRQTELDALRRRAAQHIGPQPAPAEQTSAKPPAPSKAAPAAPQSSAQPAPPAPLAAQPGQRSGQSSDVDLNFGSGPVGPLFLGVIWWLQRRKHL